MKKWKSSPPRSVASNFKVDSNIDIVMYYIRVSSTSTEVQVGSRVHYTVSQVYMFSSLPVRLNDSN